MLLCFGDSCTSGYGLDSNELSWPYSAGNVLGTSVQVIAKPGASNDWIFRQALTANLKHATHIIVAWSILSRIEYVDSAGEHTLGIPNQRTHGNLVTLNKAALTASDEWRKQQFKALVKAVDSYCKLHNIALIQTLITPQSTAFNCVDSMIAHKGYTLAEIVYKRFADAGNLACGHPNAASHKHIGETLGQYFRNFGRLP